MMLFWPVIRVSPSFMVKGRVLFGPGSRNSLKNHRSVERIRFGEAGEGGTGVTVVEFK